MKRKQGTVFSGILAGLFWYLLMPAQEVLAASENLDLTYSEPEVPGMPSLFLLLAKLVLSLAIIVGLAYITMRILRKNLKVTSRGETVRVLDQYAFSMNKGVYVTEIADRVYVLGVTDHNINLITEITDVNVIEDIRSKAADLDNESVIPPGFLGRLLPGIVPKNSSAPKSFSVHIREQINRLQTLADGSRNIGRGDDSNDQT